MECTAYEHLLIQMSQNRCIYFTVPAEELSKPFNCEAAFMFMLWPKIFIFIFILIIVY